MERAGPLGRSLSSWAGVPSMGWGHGIVTLAGLFNSLAYHSSRCQVELARGI